MKRLVWIGIGVALSLYAAKRWRELQAANPAVRAAVAASHSAVDVVHVSRGFLADFRTGMAQRERELRASLLGE